MKTLIFSIIFLITAEGYAQFYNVDIAAKIKIEKNSEFFTFKAIAENTTPSDYNLRYDFMVFSTGADGKIQKSNQEERFFLKANEKKILSNVTVNYNVEGKVILVLLIYDEEDNPIGQDRIELGEGGKTQINIEEEQGPVAASQDQSAPQDGFVMNGLVTENTITKAGRDFYKYFYSEYYNLQVTTPKNIYIEEVPGRSRNTRVTVKVENQLVWQFFTQPRKEFLKQMATIALNKAIAQLQRLEQQKDTFIHY